MAAELRRFNINRQTALDRVKKSPQTSRPAWRNRELKALPLGNRFLPLREQP